MTPERSVIPCPECGSDLAAECGCHLRRRRDDTYCVKAYREGSTVCFDADSSTLKTDPGNFRLTVRCSACGHSFTALDFPMIITLDGREV